MNKLNLRAGGLGYFVKSRKIIQIINVSNMWIYYRFKGDRRKNEIVSNYRTTIENCVKEKELILINKEADLDLIRAIYE